MEVFRKWSGSSHVTKPVAPIQDRDHAHLHYTDSGCSYNRKCQCLLSGFQCTEICLCHCDDCQNCITPSDSESDDDESDN